MSARASLARVSRSVAFAAVTATSVLSARDRESCDVRASTVKRTTEERRFTLTWIAWRRRSTEGPPGPAPCATRRSTVSDVSRSARNCALVCTPTGTLLPSVLSRSCSRNAAPERYTGARSRAVTPPTAPPTNVRSVTLLQGERLRATSPVPAVYHDVGVDTGPISYRRAFRPATFQVIIGPAPPRPRMPSFHA